jgi:hypothetical protein
MIFYGENMEIIQKHRCEGKTTDLVLMSANTGIPILAWRGMGDNIYKDRAIELGVTIPQPIKYVNGMQLMEKVLIDELDWFLKSRIGLDVYAATTPKVERFTKRDIAKRLGLSECDFEIIE